MTSKSTQVDTVESEAINPATHAAITVTGSRTLRELCDTFMPEAEAIDPDDSEDEDYSTEDSDQDDDEDESTDEDDAEMDDAGYEVEDEDNENSEEEEDDSDEAVGPATEGRIVQRYRAVPVLNGEYSPSGRYCILVGRQGPEQSQ